MRLLSTVSYLLKSVKKSQSTMSNIITNPSTKLDLLNTPTNWLLGYLGVKEREGRRVGRSA